LTPSANPPDTGATPLLHCNVLTFGSVRLSPGEIQPLRQNPSSVESDKLPSANLKNAEEQTVAGLAAVYQAIAKQELSVRSFHDWCVVGVPRFIGRIALEAALNRFAAEGAWGVSPHLIPHRSLHSLSGTISQVLKIHGPNFGAGGGLNGAEEGLLISASLVDGRCNPGVWVVLTGWDPEPAIDPQERADQPCVCNAVALALVPFREDWQGWRLRLAVQDEAACCPTDRLGNHEANWLTLERLQTALTDPSAKMRPSEWPFVNGGHLGIEYVGASRAKAVRAKPAVCHNGSAESLRVGAGTEVQS
jgi:hypothetical protein